MYTLLPLPYAYDALDPIIPTHLMQLHHGRHHQTYVDKFNAALEAAAAAMPTLTTWTPEQVVARLQDIPEQYRTPLRNHGGGVVNHNFFWQTMTPNQHTTEPVGQLAEDIATTFGSFDAFRTAFETAGMGLFGSGWVWLVRDAAGQLRITTTANQDSPTTAGDTPIITNDVWEHAYYLAYENRRADYLKAWWSVVHWEAAGAR